MTTPSPFLLLAILIGVMSFQITGWFLGHRLLSTLNLEAMLFTALFLVTLFFRWLMFKTDACDTRGSYVGRTVWWISLLLGVGFGVYMRIKLVP